MLWKKNQYNQINQNQIHSFETSSAFAADQSADNSYYEVFIIAMIPFFTVMNYSLQSFWILDNESKTHICNKNMLHRFWKTRDASSKTVLIDETRSKIEAIEKIEISINAFERKIWKVLFIEICYISNFLINIIASRKFRAKKNYFDDQDMRLHANNRTLRLMKDMHDYNVLKHDGNEIMKQSISEKMKMKNEKSISEKIKMKNNTPINNNKKTDNEVSDKIKNEKKKTYQRADSTQSHSRIKFRSFDFISLNWLKHKNVKPISITHIAVNGLAFIKTFSFQKNKKIQFDWSKNQLWRCRRDLCEMIKWSRYGFFQRCCITNKKHFDHKMQLRWENVKIYVLDYFSLLNHVHTEVNLIKSNCLKILSDSTSIRDALLGSK